MEKNFSENLSNPLKESKVSGSGIQHVAIMYQESRNNRFYTDTAMRSIKKLAEGSKSFVDHGLSSTRDLIGDFSNTVRDGKYIYANLDILKTAKERELILDIAENKPHLAGFSINARGKFADDLDSEGREVVEDVLQLYSIDFVSNPATVQGMFESQSKDELESINADLITRNEELQQENEKLEKDKRYFRDLYMKSHSSLTNREEPKKLTLEEAREILHKNTDENIW